MDTESKKSPSSVIAATVLIWAFITAVYAWFYVASRVALPGAEGYEAEWDWQLLFFGITRLPILIGLLGLTVWLEWIGLKRINGGPRLSGGGP